MQNISISIKFYYQYKKTFLSSYHLKFRDNIVKISIKFRAIKRRKGRGWSNSMSVGDTAVLRRYSISTNTGQNENKGKSVPVRYELAIAPETGAKLCRIAVVKREGERTTSPRTIHIIASCIPIVYCYCEVYVVMWYLDQLISETSVTVI